jgi:hypothetical protein
MCGMLGVFVQFLQFVSAHVSLPDYEGSGMLAGDGMEAQQRISAHYRLAVAVYWGDSWREGGWSR